MQFNINHELLKQAHTLIGHRHNIYWLVGGSGSGKSTICKELAEQYGFEIYDLDAHIYGDYHGRFSATHHPVNSAWAAASNQLAWLLDLSWQEFNNFNQAALAEYAALMADDLSKIDLNQAILIDGGICNPALATEVIPAKQMLCLANRSQNSKEVWEGSAERIAMKDYFANFSDPEATWQKFLDFDTHITKTILQEAKEANIPIYSRQKGESITNVVHEVAKLLNLQSS